MSPRPVDSRAIRAAILAAALLGVAVAWLLMPIAAVLR